MPDIIVPIPDPNMRQFIGKGPTFIKMMPPTVKGMEIRIDWMLIVYIDKPWNHHVKEYLASIAEKAGIEGLKMERREDVPTRQFIYFFESKK